MPSGEAIFLFIVGAACGIAIIAGAFLQWTGAGEKVRLGTWLILIATIVAMPSTYFGIIVGGILSVTGVALGFSWKRPAPTAAGAAPGQG